MGVILGLALVSVGWGLFASDLDFLGWPPAVALVILTLPVSSIFHCSAGWPRRVMVAATAAVAGLVVSGIALFVAAYSLDGRRNGPAVECFRLGLTLFGATTWAGLGSTFLANWLIRVRPRF